jgi:hypothetical protein
MLQIEGVSILSFYPDWMHCKSLGIDKPLLGSVLYCLVHHVLIGTVDENVAVVWKDIERFYAELGTENRYGYMRQTMFTTKSQPKLKGKAGEVKDLGPVMVKIWEKHMNPNLLIHQKILVVLKGSCFSSLKLYAIELLSLPLEYLELLITECFFEGFCHWSVVLDFRIFSFIHKRMSF